VIGLIAIAGCRRSSTDAAGGSECSDPDSCYRQAQALVMKNYEEKVAQKRATKEMSPERAAKVVTLLQKGCDLGSGISCEMLGTWLEDGRAGPPDLPHAVELHERACALKEFRACDSLALLYLDGRGVPKDPALHAKYRKLACDLAEPPMAKPTFCDMKH
jgi:TPR repeat protein